MKQVIGRSLLSSLESWPYFPMAIVKEKKIIITDEWTQEYHYEKLSAFTL
jgi:hypothetical protein